MSSVIDCGLSESDRKFVIYLKSDVKSKPFNIAQDVYVFSDDIEELETLNKILKKYIFHCDYDINKRNLSLMISKKELDHDYSDDQEKG